MVLHQVLRIYHPKFNMELVQGECETCIWAFTVTKYISERDTTLSSLCPGWLPVWWWTNK